MLLSKKAAQQQIQNLLANGNTDTCPAWLRPLAAYIEESKHRDLSIANGSVDLYSQLSVLGQGALDFEQRVANLVANIQTLAAAIEEMSASASEVGTLGQSVLEQASSVNQYTTESATALDDMEVKLREVEASLTQAVNEMSTLSDQTHSIGKLTSTVNEISEQTNLLALNAAIEAARAGDAGRGFSVVADEVRKLAGRSAEAADEINGIVSNIISGSESMQSRLSESMQAVKDSSDSRARMSEVVRQTDKSSAANHEQATSIAAASEQQSQVSSEMAQQVAASSEDSNALADIFNHLIGGIPPLRENANNIFGQIKPNNVSLMLASAKRDHVVWVDKLVRFAIFQEDSITASEVKDHTQCRLGKFLLDPENSDMSAIRGHKQLMEESHPKVHRVGQKLYSTAIEMKQQRIAPEKYATLSRELVSDLKQASDEVLALLDTMINELRK